ncbi:MAG: branched-chain amino acid ABC transporter permease, partial [Aquabacterium sp.]
MSATHYEFKPYNVGRWVVWGCYALLLLIAPLVFTSNHSASLLGQIGIGIIACLSYNMLLGQGGMLSFGHAVYSGLGSFIAIHTLARIGGNFSGEGQPWNLPVSLVPLVGGLAGLFFAAVLGYVTTKRAGTIFAMITLGIGALVWNMSLMFPEFFGGEGGITSNRSVGGKVMGVDYALETHVYYLIAIYTWICTALMFAFTRTPLGRMLNAVRDNPQRVQFIGYSTRMVRYVSFVVAGFFAGIAGGLFALSFETVTAGEVFHAERSGAYLLFTFLGGATFFFGPIIGAVLMVLAVALLSELTKAWLLYLGLIFLLMVMYAPGGIASLIMMNLRVASFGKLRRLMGAYLALAGTALVMLAGIGSMIEML